MTGESGSLWLRGRPREDIQGVSHARQSSDVLNSRESDLRQAAAYLRGW